MKYTCIKKFLIVKTYLNLVILLILRDYGGNGSMRYKK